MSYEMNLQNQIWELDGVSQQSTPNTSESIPVTDFEITTTRLEATQTFDGNLNRDTFDDSVILQFDPGGIQDK